MTLREKLLALPDQHMNPVDPLRAEQQIALAAASMALDEAAKLPRELVDRLLDVKTHGGLTEHGEGSFATAKNIDAELRALRDQLGNDRSGR